MTGQLGRLAVEVIVVPGQKSFRDRELFVCVLVGILVMLFAGLGWLVTLKGSFTDTGIIRFHVIANSDNREDQMLKEEVRDRLLAVMTPKLKNVRTAAQAREVVSRDLNLIAQEARTVLADAGRMQTVTVSLGTASFPVKAYGDLVLPAGTYEALRVVIGNGQGKNWWCVLFPPLCFVDIASSTAVEPEHNLVLGPNGSSRPVQARFKIVEILDQLGLAATDQKTAGVQQE